MPTNESQLRAAKKYQQTEKGRASQHRYQKSEKGRITHRAAQRGYYQRQKAANKKTIASEILHTATPVRSGVSNVSVNHAKLTPEPIVTPTPKRGDYVSVINEPPNHIYVVTGVDGSHVNCKLATNIEAPRRRRLPHWKLRPSCASAGCQPKESDRQPVHWTEIYCPSKKKDNKYFRYVWMDGQRMHHRHIPGGHTRSHAAQLNLAEVEQAIEDGLAPQEILRLIDAQKAAATRDRQQRV